MPDPPIKALGAGWSYDGKVYFSDNNGTGVYQLLIDEFILPPVGTDHDQTVKVKLVGLSDKTDSNDGMNCPDVEPPWPQGGCELGQFEIPPNDDGTCPDMASRNWFKARALAGKLVFPTPAPPAPAPGTPQLKPREPFNEPEVPPIMWSPRQ